MIKILKELTTETPNELSQAYVTVEFVGYHETFKEVKAIRVFRLPSDQARDEFLDAEYDRWLTSLDAVAEF